MGGTQTTETPLVSSLGVLLDSHDPPDDAIVPIQAQTYGDPTEPDEAPVAPVDASGGHGEPSRTVFRLS